VAKPKHPGDVVPGNYPSQRAEAETLVANAVRAVARQRKVAATFRRRGLNANDAEARLAQLENKLSDYEAALAAIIEREANNY
jgi:hypothetical protein